MSQRVQIDRNFLKNRAIAMSLFGWHHMLEPADMYMTPDGLLRHEWQIPNYVRDRSWDQAMMHELGRLNLQTQFISALCEVTGNPQGVMPPDPVQKAMAEAYGTVKLGFTVSFDVFLLTWATPEQRIDAILKVFNVTL